MMKKLHLGMTALVLSAGYASFAAQADVDDRRFYIAPLGSYTFTDHERGSDYGYGGEIAVGKRVTKGLDLELIGIYTNYKNKQGDFPAFEGPQPSNSQLFGAGAGANIYLAPSSAWLGGLYLHVDVLRGQGHNTGGQISNYTTTLFDPGLGYNLVLNKSSFGPFAPGVAIRFEALYRLDNHGRGQLGTATEDQQHSYFQEAVINLGLRIPLGGRSAPVAVAAEAAPEVVPVENPPEPQAEAPPPPPPCQPPAPGQPISLEGCKLGDTIVLRGVNFEFNKATLTVNAKTLLDQVGDALLARKDIKVEIDGHTDGKGTVPYNQKLSERRSASVKDYLVSRGVDAGRMTTKGYGKSMPVADNSTDEGRELNRRVELKVTEANPAAAPVEAVPTGTDTPVETPSDSSSPPADSSSTDSSSAAPAPDSSGSSPDVSNSGTSATLPADASSGAPGDAAPPPPADSTTGAAAGDSSSSAPADVSAPADSAPAADSSATSSDAPASSDTAPASGDSSTPPADGSSSSPPQ